MVGSWNHFNFWPIWSTFNEGYTVNAAAMGFHTHLSGIYHAYTNRIYYDHQSPKHLRVLLSSQTLTAKFDISTKIHTLHSRLPFNVHWPPGPDVMKNIQLISWKSAPVWYRQISHIPWQVATKFLWISAINSISGIFSWFFMYISQWLGGSV